MDLETLSQASSHSSLEFQLPIKKPRESLLDPSVEKAFKAFADAVGEDRIRSNMPFLALAESTQNRKARSVRKLLDVICKYMAGEDFEILKELALKKSNDDWLSLKNSKYDQLMHTVATQYQESNDRNERLLVLQLVAPNVTLNEIHRYIPGLSPYYFKLARHQAIIQEIPDQSPIIREKYDKNKVNLFLEFITRFDANIINTFLVRL